MKCSPFARGFPSYPLFACIDRPTHRATLDAFAAPAEHDGKGLVITGDSGSGNTALLAAWGRMCHGQDRPKALPGKLSC